MQKAKEKQKERNERGGEKMENSLKIKRQRGITLIALVITIIVLLILAAVSIATLTGENGILTKANKAKEETEIASKEEQRKLAVAEANMNDEETEFQGVKIPAGFAPTKIEGESTIDEGMVIVDSEGNSYVWIEVPKTEAVYATAKLDITDFSDEEYGKIETDLKNYVGESYRNSNYKDEWYSKEQSGLEKADYDNLKKKMLKSVYENGGFWIGQYEVGYEQGVEKDYRYDENQDNYAEHKIDEKPVIKVNAYPYNWVRCSQAQELASKINHGNYTSSLMFGIQWDLVMKYIETKEGKTQEQLKTNSAEWGNYLYAQFDITKGKYSTDNGQTFKDVSGSYQKIANEAVLLTTGASERNRVLNIYDIAGNVWEWTLEQYTTGSNNPCCTRGGNYNSGDGFFPASSRNDYSTSSSRYYVGFRSALYVR